jgi:hypothetical protein
MMGSGLNRVGEGVTLPCCRELSVPPSSSAGNAASSSFGAASKAKVSTDSFGLAKRALKWPGTRRRLGGCQTEHRRTVPQLAVSYLNWSVSMLPTLERLGALSPEVVRASAGVTKALTEVTELTDECRAEDQ